MWFHLFLLLWGVRVRFRAESSLPLFQANFNSGTVRLQRKRKLKN